MSFFIILTAAVLGYLIIAIEIRREVAGYIDFFRGVSIAYFILFVIVPIWIQIVGEWAFYRRSWEWALKRPLDHVSFFQAELLALFSYVICFSSYFVFSKSKLFKVKHALGSKIYSVSNKYLFSLCIFLFAIAGMAFIFNVLNYGGLSSYLTYGMIVRSGVISISDVTASRALVFIKNFARIAMAVTLLLFALRKRYSNYRLLVNTLLVSSFIISLLVLFNGAGRLSFIAFLGAIGFYRILVTDKFDLKKVIFIGLVFAVLALVGKQFFAYFFNPTSLGVRIQLFIKDLLLIPNFIIIEFSFPFISLANAVVEVGESIQYRFFYDYIGAFYQLLPSKLLGINTQDFVNASIVNSDSFGKEAGIPVDTVTFGFMSLGIIGVAFVSALFGYVTAFFEKLLPYVKSPLILVLRANWILLIAFSIMYGNPKQILFRNLYFIIPTFLLFLPAIVKPIGKK